MKHKRKSREHIFSMGYQIVTAEGYTKAPSYDDEQDYLRGVIAALIAAKIDKPQEISDWMASNLDEDSANLVVPLLWEHEGQDCLRHLWKLKKNGRYRLMFDFAPYRSQSAQPSTSPHKCVQSPSNT